MGSRQVTTDEAFFSHGLKEAYKQMGNISFCWIILTPIFLGLAGGFSFSEAAIGNTTLSMIFSICAGITALFSALTYWLHYIHLYKIRLKHKETGELRVVRHSSRYPDRLFEEYIPHCSTGPAVTGYDADEGTPFKAYFFEGKQIDEQAFEEILNASSKGELNKYFVCDDEDQRNFAKHRAEFV